MEVISKWRRCTVDGLTGANRRTRASVLVTLDDAYRDNLVNAWPILQRYDVPAVIFAASTLCARGEPFWWDVMRRVFGPESKVTTETLEALYRQLEALGPATGNKKVDVPAKDPRALFACFHGLMRLGSDVVRRRFVAEGLALLGGPTIADEGWPMSPEELRQISQDGLIEIGGHTRTHPLLSTLSLAEQQHEIAGGKAELEAMLGHPVRCFAYPYGSPATDFDASSVSVAREAGYAAAFAFLPSLIDDDSDPLEYGRFRVDDYGGDELARRLVLWFGRPHKCLGRAPSRTTEM
jgi:peptidoglycan/xylan/chitin deacetylase (PgdA/CDA1 family)